MHDELQDLGDRLMMGFGLCVVLVRCRRLQDIQVQGTTKSKRKKPQEWLLEVSGLCCRGLTDFTPDVSTKTALDIFRGGDS